MYRYSWTKSSLHRKKRIYGSLIPSNNFNFNSTNNLYNNINHPSKMLAAFDTETYFESTNDRETKGIIPLTPTDLQSMNSFKTDASKILRARNPETMKYFNLIQKLTPNEMIAKFAKTAPTQVQEAAKSTIMTLFGSFPNYALDAALITTNTKLANLLFQMQITGYMLKNAEYRMSLTRTLKGLPKLPSETTLKQGNITINPLQDATRMNGRVTVKTSGGNSVDIDVNDLTDALSQEINALRSELSLIRNEREKELRSNLLTYIQALPEKDLQKLTSDMSPDVIQAIEMLVQALMEKMGVDSTKFDEVVIQQSVGMLAQVCMWQLITGYKLREYEALERGATLE